MIIPISKLKAVGLKRVRLFILMMNFETIARNDKKMISQSGELGAATMAMISPVMIADSEIISFFIPVGGLSGCGLAATATAEFCERIPLK